MSHAAPEMGSSPAAYLVHDDTLDVESVREVCTHSDIVLLPWERREECPPESRVMVCVGDERGRDFGQLAMARDWAVGVLPNPEAPQAAAALGVKGEPTALLEHYLTAPVVEVDALTCNDELVFSSVVIGKVLALRPTDINRPQRARYLVSGALKGLGKMKLRAFKLTTAKDKEINMAALGMVVLGQTQRRLLGQELANDVDLADGRLSVLALAPRSVFSFLHFLFFFLLPRKLDFAKLPSAMSLIQTSQLHISTPKGIEYLLDGKPVHASEIELKIAERGLRVLPGPALKLRPEDSRANDKETVRLNKVPVDSAAKSLVDQPLPLFDHATEEEYRELFVALRDSASATSSYKVLMVLSVLLALGGMYANSAPVIIGAMILAPLMAPIISLSMGLARSDVTLMKTSGRTMLVGIGWGLGCAILLALAMPLETPTLEMKSRMSPTLLDLLVAVVSGIAGAYANAKEEIAKSLAGVAIAVALVPPLSVVGIGLGWGDWDMAYGAALLLITNLVGIALAASLTFLVLGFAPFKRARAGLTITLTILLVISLPLSISFSRLVTRDRILDHIPAGEFKVLGEEVQITAPAVKLGNPHLVRVVVSSRQPLTMEQIDQIKGIIRLRVEDPMDLEVQNNIRR